VSDLSYADIELLREAVADWLANRLMSIPVDMHDDPAVRSRFDAMVAVGNKLGMDL
jgi:hypothetical protein